MVSLLDVAPTLLAMVGAPPQPGFEGVDLQPLWGRPEVEAEPRLLYCEADHYNAEHNIKRAVRHERFKLHHDLRTKQWALYDLVPDPGEGNNVVAGEVAMADLLRASLQEFMRVQVTADSIGPLPSEEIERLRSLGYLR